MLKHVSKWLSILLIFSLTFITVAPQTALASPAENQMLTSDTETEPPSAHRVKEQKHILELEDKRDKNTKYFMNSDGSITAEATINSRHYKDSDGKWQDISNKLVSSDEPGFALRNEANSFKTHFANTSQAENLVKVKLDQNERLSWSLDNANHVSAFNDDYSVTYPDILPAVDLQYAIL